MFMLEYDELNKFQWIVIEDEVWATAVFTDYYEGFPIYVRRP